MIAIQVFASILSAGTLVAAVPAPVPTALAQLESRAGSCVLTNVAAVSKSKSSCATMTLSNIAVPSGQTLDLTKLNEGTTVVFAGTTTFGYKEWEGPLISVSGSRLTIKGATGHVIDGNGPAWWDGKGSNGGKKKPKFFFAHFMKQSTISSLNVKNTPVQGFSINSATDLTLDHITIDNSAGDVTNGGHNTDAFDIGSSTGITISNANIHNQDDCLAINSGTNIHFVGGTCSGGHGLSIGSVGGRADNIVDGVVIATSHIFNSQNGVRVKTVAGATGSVHNVSYKDITLSNISKYGIVLQQDYQNGSPTGNPTTGIPITEFRAEGITGSVAEKAIPVYVLCGKGACSDWTWAGVQIAGGVKSTKCQNVPAGASC
ncbi:glycoside hydrolase [Massariosphaeria phaeospora]|uniref:endo-polygalacturonase n=1 Tax=Massariosphaeria phaeospora TaxID=100035 RepID=A0A7C8M142_9PLEO|nr:glycoside hydrolase [Massariosphaeria phaeospora]